METEKEWGLRLNDHFEALLQGGLILRRLTPEEQGLGGRWREVKLGGHVGLGFGGYPDGRGGGVRGKPS